MRIRSVRFPGALILAATFALSALPDPASAQQPGCRFLLDNCGPQNPPEGIPAPQQTPVPPPPTQTPAPIPPPAPGSGNCGHPHGDYVVVRVKWGDAIGGLAVRSAPDGNAERLEGIPATGPGVGVLDFRAGWCQVKHACASGWASAAFLSPRTSEIYRVTGVSANDPQGLNVRTGPAYT